MKNAILHPKWKWGFYIYSFVMALTLTGCSGDNNPPIADTGRLQVQTIWPAADDRITSQQASPGKDVCVDFQITHVQIRVKTTSGKVAAQSERLPCAKHKAQLDGIAPQSGYNVEVEGFVGDQVQWFGKTEGVNVIADQTTEPVRVVMNFTGEATIPPTAIIQPKDEASNVPTDSAVTITFDKAMVAASINTDTIRVSSGKDTVPGKLTYNSKAFEAVFKPDLELDVRTTYNVKVTKEVMDINGQSPADEKNSRFTTTTVWYVDVAVAESGTGKTWAEAFKTISEALTVSEKGDHIWVKQGTYRPPKELKIDKPIELLGGFEGIETQHHQRDWEIRKTEVDGKGERRCCYISSDAVIDGFTFTDGYSIDNRLGGGAFYIDGASPMIANNTFVGNIGSDGWRGYGGAIFIATGNPVITKCTFIDNNVEIDGGTKGGAIYNRQGGPNISSCIFKGNHVFAEARSGGGAIYNDQAKATTTISDCLFDSNYAFSLTQSGGGAISNEGGEVQITECRFKNNYTGGYHTEGYDSEYVGGAIENWNTHANLHNNTFYANFVNVDVYKGETKAIGHGGAVAIFNSSVSITNCAFSSNEVAHTLINGVDAEPADPAFSNGGAIASRDGSKVVVVNSILWGDRAEFDREIYTDKSSSTSVSYSNIDQIFSEGSHNLQINPRFGADLHLRFDSPCLGKADSRQAPDKDIDGDTRPAGIDVDMGADQFVDSDNDKLPDFWETQQAVSSASEDNDNDRLSNLDEYHLGSDPNIAQQIVDADLIGDVSNDGLIDLSKPAKIEVGSEEYRSFFVFEITKTKTVKKAVLRLKLTDFEGMPEEYRIKIWNVSTEATQFSKDIKGQAGIEIFNDLGGGVQFGEFAPNTFDVHTIIDIPLYQAAVDAINSASNGSKNFIIGASLHLIGSPPYARLEFDYEYDNPIYQLILDEE